MHAMLTYDDQRSLSPATDQETQRSVRLGALGQFVAGDGGDELREILKDCMEAIGWADWQRATQGLAALSSKASPQGDANQRLAFYFCNALTYRLIHHERQFGESLTIQSPVIFPRKPWIDQTRQTAAYLALNRATPFVRFAHLTANQAILELASESGEGKVLHIIDLNIKQGLQWPPLMQALSNRTIAAPRLRISAFSSPMECEELQKTGTRLSEFAHSLGLPFEFNPVAGKLNDPYSTQKLKSDHHLSEIIAVNLTLQLHPLPNLPSNYSTTSLMETIQSLNPKVITVSDHQECIDCSHRSSLGERLKESLDYYSAIFQSLEATLPASSTERLQIEQVMLGEEIQNTITACEDHHMMEKHHINSGRRWSWEWLEKAGFQRVAPGGFAVAQAKLLLRLHYPSGGYKLWEKDRRLLLAWEDRPVLAVSSWQRR